MSSVLVKHISHSVNLLQMFLLLSDYNCQLGSHLSCITTPISHKSTLIPSCSWGHIPRVTLLHLVSHYRKWDIQLDGLCNNGTQRTHFKLKSWVHERHGKGGQSSIIIRDSILLSLSLSLSFLNRCYFWGWWSWTFLFWSIKNPFSGFFAGNEMCKWRYAAWG